MKHGNNNIMIKVQAGFSVWERISNERSNNGRAKGLLLHLPEPVITHPERSRRMGRRISWGEPVSHLTPAYPPGRGTAQGRSHFLLGIFWSALTPAKRDTVRQCLHQHSCPQDSFGDALPYQHLCKSTSSVSSPPAPRLLPA